MTSYNTIETPQDYVNYTFNISARGFTEVAGEFAGLSNTVTTILGQLAFKTSEYLTHTETLIASLGLAATAAFSSATQEAIRFEQAIANVQAIGGESINAMEIGQAAMQYSSQFGMDVNSMTEGLEALSRAGLTATNVMSQVLEEGVKLSKLEGIDLEDSINNLISTTNLLAEEQFDTNSEEYAQAVKAMNQHIVSTSESAPINAENIIQTLQHVGGYASANKIDQDDLFAVIAQLGSKGTKGEMAGTALRAFIAAGQKDQAQRALSRIGLKVSDLWDSSGNAMLPVSEMKRVLDEALEARGYSQQEKLEFYSDFAGYKQANQIMKINVDEVQDYKSTIADAWDLGKKLDTILGTTNSNLQILFQTVKNFMTKVGATVLPIINAIVIPLKLGVQLLDKMPFSENIVGMILAFTGLKAGILLINRVIPSLASLYTSFNKSKNASDGIAKNFFNIRKDLEKSVKILKMVRTGDKEGLSEIRLQDGLMGAESYKLHQKITGQIYEDVIRPTNPNLNAWEDLTPIEKQIHYGIVETFKGTDIYRQYFDSFQNELDNYLKIYKGIHDATVNPNVSFSNTSTKPDNRELNREEHLAKKQGESQNSTKEVTENTKIINRLPDEVFKPDNKRQKDIADAILGVKDTFAMAIGRAVSDNLNVEDIFVSDSLGYMQIDKRKSEGAVTQLQAIEKSVSNNLGDIGYFLEYDLDKIDSLIAAVKDDLQGKITAYSNTNPAFMNHQQKFRMEKIISGAVKTELGQAYSREQNSIDIHNVLTTGKWNDPGVPYLGIHEKQLSSMEEILKIKNGNGLDRDTRLNKIHSKLIEKTEEEQKELVKQILKQTEEDWQDIIGDKTTPGTEARQYLTDTRAAFIGNTLGLGGVNWHQLDNPAQKLIDYFAKMPDSKIKERQLKDADRIMLSFMEQAKAEGEIFNPMEAKELGYLIRRYKQLLIARNKAIELENKKSFDMKDIQDWVIGQVIDFEDATWGENYDKQRKQKQTQSETLNLTDEQRAAYHEYVGGRYENIKGFLSGKNPKTFWDDATFDEVYNTPLSSGLTAKEAALILLPLMQQAPGLLEDSILWHGGELNTYSNGIGFLPDIRSLSYLEDIAQSFIELHPERYKVKVYAPAGTPGLIPDDDFGDSHANEEEYTIPPSMYFELARDDINRYAEIFIIPFEKIKEILEKTDFSQLELLEDYWGTSSIKTFLDSVHISFNDEMEEIGKSIGNEIRINPNLLRKYTYSRDFKTLPQGMLEVYTHEAAHNMLKHEARTSKAMAGKSSYIPELDFEYEGYTGQELIAEFEADSVIRAVEIAKDISPSKAIKKRWDTIKTILEENNAMQYVDEDMVNQVSAEMVSFTHQFNGKLIQALHDSYEELLGGTYNMSTSNASEENKLKAQQFSDVAHSISGFAMKFFDESLLSDDDIDYGEVSSNDFVYSPDYSAQKEQEIEEKIKQQQIFEDNKNKNNNSDKKTCCSEIKKFLTTITQNLADFSKIFAQMHKKIEDIFNEIKDKEEVVINNYNDIYNILNVFDTHFGNIHNSILGLPQDIGNTIKQLPPSIASNEDFIDVQALVVEDIEKAVLMIETAYISPTNITSDEPYQDANISLDALYNEVHGSKDIHYDTPPLLSALLALPEKIQEVTTDFVMIGDVIDKSAETLSRYLFELSLVGLTPPMLLPPGSSKGYHNAYPENAGIFSPLPTDTLTLAKNIYTQRVVREPYNVTEQQLRSVGLHGLVSVWQQNLQKFTPYENPIGPKPDNTDLGKYLQAQAIEEENKRLRKQQEAQAHAELQAREAEKLAGITERYNKKMAESKARGDKKAAENLAAIEKARADREDREDRERPLEDKVVDALHSPKLAEAISLTDKKEKKDAWDKRVEDIKYNQHKNTQVTTLGMSGYYAYLNDIAYEKIQKEKDNQALISGHSQIENDLLIKEARKLAPLYERLFINYTELNEIIEQEIKDKKNLQGATDTLLDSQTKTSQYIKPIGPEPFKSVGDHNAAQESIRRLKERRYQQQVDAFGYGPGRGNYYAQMHNIPEEIDNTLEENIKNEQTTKEIGLTALEQAALMKKQNDNLKAQQEEFLNIAINVSQQAKIEEDNRRKIENINKIVKELEEEYNKLVKDIRIRYELGESLTNEEVTLLPNDKRVVKTKDGKEEIYEGVRDTEFSRNPQRVLAMMFDRFESQQNAVKVREPLSLLEREAYNTTRMLFDRFEMAYEFIQNSMMAIAEILIGIHNQVLKLNGGPVTEYIDTRIVPPKLLGEGDSRDSTITMKGGVAYGGSEEDVRAWEEEWENIPEEPTYWEKKAQQMHDSFMNMGKSIDDFLDKKLSRFSDDTSGLGKASRKVRLFTYSLENFQDAMTKAGKIFPPFLAIAAAMEGVIGILSTVTTGLATAETILTAARMINTEVTKEEAKAEGQEAAWHMAETIKKYTKGHKNIQAIISKGSKYITQAAHAIMGGIDAALGFIMENIAIIGPIVAAAAIAIGALWLSEQNHAKALKEATEEQENAISAAKESYTIYKNIHDARKNETNAIKRQQLARKESIALYKLEEGRIRQLNAINKKSDLRNDALWGEYGLRAEYQKQGGLWSMIAGDFESQYEEYDGSTGEIRKIIEDSLGNGGVMTTDQATVSAWYNAHVKQLGQIEAFAPQLQSLYDLETGLIDKYGSKEAARNSKEFRKAVKEFANATGINKETAERYLDYLQTEANVENARTAMQAEVAMIVSNAQAEAYKALYGDASGMGELNNVQDAMVYATANQIFKDAYQELWWSMLMEWLAAIWNQLTFNGEEASKHAKAAGAYQDGMRELGENQQRITQKGVDIAEENQRRDYGNGEYEYDYGDTPFGGAVASAAAEEQDWALEAIWGAQSDYHNASKMNGEAAAQGFKEGLDQHSPGKIARSMKSEMIFGKEAIEKGGTLITQSVHALSGATVDAFGTIYDTTTNGVDWVGKTIFNTLTGGHGSAFKGFSKSFSNPSNTEIDNSTTVIHIDTININTEDDPEKIKTAFMNLMIELSEQVVPRQVSRTIGEPPASTTTTQDNATEETDENEEGNTNTNENSSNPNSTI